jgi:NAD dependent epimerase/dehydratase family enzyme
MESRLLAGYIFDDLCRLYLDAIENENLSGVYNAVAPKPVSNKEFTIQLAKAMNGNWFIPIPVPAFALKIIVGEMSVEVLKSATVSAEKIMKTGFVFNYPTLETALPSLI